MIKIEIKTLADTEKLAKLIANFKYKKLIITLNGDLAAGKTTFTKYFAKYLGVTETVTSPTFNILKEYEINEGMFYHIDAYRLENIDEDLGFEDIFYDDNVVVIEWGEFISDFLPSNRLDITIELENNNRVFTIKALGQELLEIERELISKW